MRSICSKTSRFSFLPTLDVEGIGSFAVSAARAQNATITGENLSNYEVQVTVTVVKKDGTRIGDRTYIRLLKSRIEENGTSAWYNGPHQYLFDFKQQKFMWGNRDLYLTPAQQYDLYGCLILGESVDRVMAATLRKTFGKEFLEGLI